MTRIEREAYRRDVVHRFRESGMTRKGFCRENGVALSTLDLWIRRYRDESIDPQEPAKAFIPIGSTVVAQQRRHLRITNRIGVTIELDLPASEDEIATVLRAFAAV
jgi:transposase-like protein